jgi:CTP:molybdopterin cytidylyltransferase MocA
MIAALILCAGAGARLGGVDKAALRLPDGRTFLAAVIEAARAGGCGALVGVARPGQPLAGVERVENPAPENGMISSIATGLAALAGRGVRAALVWPVDHPGVAAATIAEIAEAAAANRIVVPVLAGRGGHPTAFGADVWAELAVATTARDVVAADPRRVIRLAVTDPGVRVDVDTPADLAGV